MSQKVDCNAVTFVTFFSSPSSQQCQLLFSAMSPTNNVSMKLLERRDAYVNGIYTVTSRTSAIALRTCMAMYKDNCLTAECGTVIEPGDFCYRNFRETWLRRNFVFSVVCRMRTQAEVAVVSSHLEKLTDISGDTKKKSILSSRLQELKLQLDGYPDSPDGDSFLDLYDRVCEEIDDIYPCTVNPLGPMPKNHTSLKVMESYLAALNRSLKHIVSVCRSQLCATLLGPYLLPLPKPSNSNDIAAFKQNSVNVVPATPSPKKSTTIRNPYGDKNRKFSSKELGIAALRYHINERGGDDTDVEHYYSVISKEIRDSSLPPHEAYGAAFQKLLSVMNTKSYGAAHFGSKKKVVFSEQS